MWGALASVLKNFEVGELWVAGSGTHPAYRSLLALAREREIPIRRRIAGERFDRGGVRIRVLWPQEQESGEDESLILRLEWEDTGFFFRAIFEGRSRGGYLRSSNRSLWRF